MDDVQGLTRDQFEDIRELLKYKVRSNDFFAKNYEELPQPTNRLMSGSFGYVKKVRSSESGEEFAIKVIKIHSQVQDHQRQEKRLQRSLINLHRAFLEALVFDRYNLYHPNISRAHPDRNWVVLPEKVTDDYAFELAGFLDGDDSIDVELLEALIGTEVFLVFDWYPDDLTSFLPTVIPSEKEARLYRQFVQRLLIQVARALGYVHDRDLVHADLKPNNLLVSVNQVTGELNIFLCDFGLTKFLGNGPPPILDGGNKMFCDDPAKYYTPMFDSWSYGHLLFYYKMYIAMGKIVSINGRLELFKAYARGKRYHELRDFLNNNLIEEHSSIRELIVQCVMYDENLRPDSKSIVNVMEQGDDVFEACHAAQEIMRFKEFQYSEQMIFPKFFRHILTSMPENPESAMRIDSNLKTRMCIALDRGDNFPIMELSKNCDVRELNTFADYVQEHFSMTDERIR